MITDKQTSKVLPGLRGSGGEGGGVHKGMPCKCIRAELFMKFLRLFQPAFASTACFASVTFTSDRQPHTALVT